MTKTRVIIVTIVLVLAGCKVASGFTVIDPNYTGVRITADSVPTDTYNLIAQAGSPLTQVDLSAPGTNQGGNTRTSFFPAGQAATTSGTVCATWVGPGTPADDRQQGLALRVETNAKGVRRAITVTKNIWLGATWLMNVNLWTVTQTSGSPDQITQTPTNLDFTSVVGQGTDQAFPWRVCAQATAGTIVVDVGTASSPHEPFVDPTYFQTVSLPVGWEYPGQFGWYIGHLQPNTSFTYTDLSAGP